MSLPMVFTTYSSSNWLHPESLTSVIAFMGFGMTRKWSSLSPTPGYPCDSPRGEGKIGHNPPLQYCGGFWARSPRKPSLPQLGKILREFPPWHFDTWGAGLEMTANKRY